MLNVKFVGMNGLNRLEVCLLNTVVQSVLKQKE